MFEDGIQRIRFMAVLYVGNLHPACVRACVCVYMCIHVHLCELVCTCSSNLAR